MKTANLTKVSDKIIYRQYRGNYYRLVNTLKYYDDATDFKIGNANQLNKIYEVVATMLLRRVITTPDAERLMDLTVLREFAKCNSLLVETSDAEED